MGAYSSRARAFRKRKNLPLQSLPSQQDPKAKPEPKRSPKKRAALRKRWAQLIKAHQARSLDCDPLRCDCGGTYRVSAFITEQKVILPRVALRSSPATSDSLEGARMRTIRKILAHLEERKSDSRLPPEP